jgi:hypothetical protein
MSSKHSPFKTKFRAHRVGGICFLSAYLSAWLYYIFAYETFIQSRLAVLPAMIGLFQAVSAAATFWFLPKEKDSGFFSDKGILSALFVRENIFYQLITTFGPFYYLFSEDLEGHFMGRGLVVLFVFLPYAVLRPLFPTTRFDYAQDGKKVGKYRSLEVSITVASDGLYGAITAFNTQGLRVNHLRCATLPTNPCPFSSNTNRTRTSTR